jgi:hypothetical protein
VHITMARCGDGNLLLMSHILNIALTREDRLVEKPSAEGPVGKLP